MVDIIQITSRSSLVRSVAEESYRALRMRQLPPDIADLVVEWIARPLVEAVWTRTIGIRPDPVAALSTRALGWIASHSRSWHHLWQARRELHGPLGLHLTHDPDTPDDTRMLRYEVRELS